MPSNDPQNEQARARVGQPFGRKWHIDALIGVGGMAAVYSATHRNGARAAIKVLHPECAANTEAIERFFREAYIANRVGHDGSVKVLDDDTTEAGEAYLVMELLEGRAVNEWLAEHGGRAPMQESLEIVEQTLAVLECAHAAGIVHRDLKPENLFLCDDGKLKMLDFGIARLHEGEVSQTRTGFTMGTPEFMAPEQAMARWDEVDGRTDLWAVGALLFSLISGTAVHEGETAGEIMVLAATRPARSFASVMPNAPFPLVRLIDRALEYDVALRFSDAAEMRAEVVALLDPSRAPHASSPSPSPSSVTEAPSPSIADSPPPPEASTLNAVRRDRMIDDGDIGVVSDEDLRNTKEFLSLFERMLIARVHYGASHPELKNRLAFVLEHCNRALRASDGGLFWNITPYSFTANGETLWLPKAPLDQIPYQLFADGFRTLGIMPGLSADEFEEFVHIIAIDKTRAMAPEDDFVTLFWDSGLENVVYHTVDAFDDGDQTSRMKFEQDRSAVLNLRRFDTSHLLERSWQQNHQVVAPDDGERSKRIFALLNAGLPTDAEAESRVAGIADASKGLASSAADAGALRIDESVRRMLAAQLDIDAHVTGERFILAAAQAFEATEGRAGISVTTPIRLALDHLAPSNPQAAIAFARALCQTVARDFSEDVQSRFRASIARQIISETTLVFLLEGATQKGTNQDIFCTGLEMLLGYLDDTYFTPVANALRLVDGTALADTLLQYLRRTGAGHEAELGALLNDASVELGLAVVTTLAAINSDAARDAIAGASRSPHAVVRIAALGHVEGVSSERLRVELRTLLEDDEPDVRVMALQAMRKHMIRVAGPFLVLRIKSAAFDKLSIHERREALLTLATLAPSRAEAIGIELLAAQKVMSSPAREDTREAAAAILGRVGSSPQAREALERASKGKWRNSERVRASACESLDEMDERAQEPGATSPGGVA